MRYPENRDNVQERIGGARGCGCHRWARKRTTRNVALTTAGREYVEAIVPALSDIRNATQVVADHRRKPTGTLRFSCSPSGGRQLLVPFVLEYIRRSGGLIPGNPRIVHLARSMATLDQTVEVRHAFSGGHL
jgi:DNA-binding transcriptional LysR family regulator